MTLNTQGLVVYFHHLTQLFGSPEAGDNLNDGNLRDEYGCLYVRKEAT